MKSNLLSRSLEILKIAKAGRDLGKADSESVRQNAAALLAERLGRLRGLPQKMGQILSMNTASDFSDNFKVLTQSYEPVSFDVIKEELVSGWGCDLSEVVTSIDETGIAASLGQVHKALLKDGTQAAIKVRYPNIKQAVLNDLKLLGWLSVPAGNLKRGFDLKGYQEAILSDLENELDYLKEAGLQKRYYDAAAAKPYLKIPQVYSDLCRENILVTEWVEGEDLMQVQKRTLEDRRKAALAVARHFTGLLFNNGYVHADPHPGNYRFLFDGGEAKLLLYDFGSLYESSNDEHLWLLRLILQAADKEAGSVLAVYKQLGFDEAMLEPLRDKLPALTHVLFEPFCCDFAYDLKAQHRAGRVTDILGEDRWNFRIAAPAQLIFLVRAYAGIEYYIRELDVAILWPIVLKEVDPQVIAKAKALVIPADENSCGHEMLATYLKIRVTENGFEKVQLTFPARSVEDLKSLMDEDILQKARDRSIDIDEVRSKARSSGYRPGELFSLTEGKKIFKVWLE